MWSWMRLQTYSALQWRLEFLCRNFLCSRNTKGDFSLISNNRSKKWTSGSLNEVHLGLNKN